MTLIIEELEIRISNYLSGNCTEEEKEALFAYLASNEDAAKIFREMSAVWAVSSVPAFAKVEDANLSQIKEKIAAAEMKPVRSRKSRVSDMVAILPKSDKDIIHNLPCHPLVMHIINSYRTQIKVVGMIDFIKCFCITVI